MEDAKDLLRGGIQLMGRLGTPTDLITQKKNIKR